MTTWNMVTFIGHDRPGIVARVSRTLYEGGFNLGEASMHRLGGNFTIMLMVQHEGEDGSLQAALEPVAEQMDLRINVEPIEGQLHENQVPDVSVLVHGADRAGIVAQVTGVLADAGVNILDLRSDVAGTPEAPIYVMHIEGVAQGGVDALREALDRASIPDVEVTINPITTMMG